MTKAIEKQEDELEGKALVLLEVAQNIVVTDAESYEAAAGFLKKIKDGTRVRQDFFADMKANAYKAWKAIVAKENESLAPLTDADTIVREKVGVYLDEEARLRRIAQRKEEDKARVEAERKRKELEKRAGKAKKPETKERLEEEAQDVFEEPVFVQPEVDKTTKLDSGSITRKTDIQITVTDKKAFLAAVASGEIPTTCVDIKTNKVKAWVKAAGIKKIPGAHIKEVSGVSIR